MYTFLKEEREIMKANYKAGLISLNDFGFYPFMYELNKHEHEEKKNIKFGPKYGIFQNRAYN